MRTPGKLLSSGQRVTRYKECHDQNRDQKVYNLLSYRAQTNLVWNNPSEKDKNKNHIHGRTVPGAGAIGGHYPGGGGDVSEDVEVLYVHVCGSVKKDHESRPTQS